MSERYTWAVNDAAGRKVASGEATKAADATREATHYAVQYAQDGPVTWWIKSGRKFVVRGSLAGVTITRSTQ